MPPSRLSAFCGALLLVVSSCAGVETICTFNGTSYTCPDRSDPYSEDSTNCCVKDDMANCCSDALLDTWAIGVIVGCSGLFLGVLCLICICCRGCPLNKYHSRSRSSDYREIG